MKTTVAIIGFCAVLALGTGCSKESRKARFVESGDKYLAANYFAEAEVQYLNAFRLDPQSTLLMQRLGTIYYKQGRWERAYAFLERSKSGAGDPIETQFMLGAMYYAGGELPKAREELAGVIAKDLTYPDALGLVAEMAQTPAERKQLRDQIQAWRQKAGDKAAFHIALGILATRENDAQSAEKEFKEALALEAGLASAHASLGALLWQRNDTAAAERELKAAADASPARSPRRVQFAEFKAKTGAIPEAKTVLAQVIEATPDFLPAWKQLAELQFSAGEYDECAKSVARVLAMEPMDNEAGIMGARLKLVHGKPEEAVKELERLRSRNVNSPGFHYHLALAQLANKDPRQAAASLQQSVILNTNLYEPAILLADLKTRQGDAGGAVALLTDIVQKRPNDETALYLLADAYRIRGNLDDSLNVYRGLMRAFPKNPKAALFLGAVLRQQKRATEARKAFETAIEIDPSSATAINQLVELDLMEKNLAGALVRVQSGLQKNPNSAELRLIEAKVLMASGDSAKAEAALRKSLELAPDFREAYMGLAQIYIATKKPDLALEELGKALAKNPKETGTLMIMAMLYEAKGSFSQAKDAYDKILAINPQFGPALNNLAYLTSVHLKQPEAGYALARKARQLVPNDPAIADTLGWITYLRGDYAAALPLLQESAEKLIDEPEVHYHLGMAHYMMGNEKPARAALQAAAQGKKEFNGKDDAAQKLAILDPEQGGSPLVKIPGLEKAAAQNPNDVILLLKLGSLYEETGAADKALDVSERALKLNPKAVRAMLVLARLYGARPDGSQRALEYAKSARAAAPDDAEAAHATGRTAFQVGQHEWAYSILQETSRQQSGNPEIAYDFSWAAYSMGKVAEAESAMQTALRGGTTFSRAEPARRFLAMVALAKDPAAVLQATAQIRDALKTEPNYVPALMAAAVGSEHRGAYAEARGLYDQVLARFPQFMPATRNLAILYANHLDDPQKGYELGAKARLTLPGDWELARAVGKLSYKRGDYQYAAQLLKEVHQKNAADAQVYYYLGMSQYRLKQKADSTASLRRALALNLDAKLGEEATRVLAELE